jgi:hypothetical protein
VPRLHRAHRDVHHRACRGSFVDGVSVNRDPFFPTFAERLVWHIRIWLRRLWWDRALDVECTEQHVHRPEIES